jgi:lipopolysaccharide transport system ATP-binding protein
MYVRLAFAVAAHLEPEILIVDEVLAVGDGAFQKKCLGKMGSVVNQGRTVLLVSHNMAAITALCTRGLLFEKGSLAFSGSPREVVEEYLVRSRTAARIRVADRVDRRGAGRMRFTDMSVLSERGQALSLVSSGQDITFCADYDIPGGQPLSNVVVQIKFFGSMGQPLFACSSLNSSGETLSITPGGRLLCKVPKFPLIPGLYTYTIWCTVGGTLEDLVADAGEISVVEGDFFATGKLPPKEVGDFLVAHSWSLA